MSTRKLKLFFKLYTFILFELKTTQNYLFTNKQNIFEILTQSENGDF